MDRSNLTDAKSYYEKMIAYHESEIAEIQAGRVMQQTKQGLNSGWVDTTGNVLSHHQRSKKELETLLAGITKRLTDS